MVAPARANARAGCNLVESVISRNALLLIGGHFEARLTSAMVGLVVVVMVTMINLSRFRTCGNILRFVLFLAAISLSSANYCSERANIDTCYQTIEPLLENEQLSGLPTTKESLQDMCRAFRIGMKCVDDYAKNCLTQQHQNYLHATVAGARQMMKYLCDDSEFQNEYLKHTSCYKDLREEWDLCTLQMKKVVHDDRRKKEKVSQEVKMRQLCCAKYEFMVCTEEVSYKKCSKEASAILKIIAETLSGSMLNGKCKEMKPDPCIFVSALASRSKAPFCIGQSVAMIFLPIVSLKMT